MKKTAILLALLLILPAISAVNLEVAKKSSGEVLIAGLNEPVIFDLEIKNLGAKDNLEFYNLVGFEMFPVGKTPINAGETKEVQLKFSPIGEFPYRGAYTFSYYIRGDDNSEITQPITFRSIDLKDAFEIGAGEINSEENSAEIYLRNKVNFDFEKIELEVTSAFFNFKETFALDSKQRKNFTVQLNKEDFKKLTAGFYTLNAEIKVKNEKAELQESLKFVEKNLLTTTKKDYGLVINTQIITKINEGNVVENSEIKIQKNIISRLFTTFSPEPDIIERKGFKINYAWIDQINPGESLEIKVKTNWLFPLIIIFFIIAIIILAKKYSMQDLVLRKKVSFLKAKGGEFALKITIFAHSRKYLERVNIVDRLPALTKVYEKFGTEKPSRIDEKNKRIEWNFEKLEAGETRILNYILYSKIGVLGKFALPPATSIYEKDGKIKESVSNKAFFVSEQKREEEGEY